MSDGKFYQFPLAVLAMKEDPKTIADRIISYGIVSAGISVLKGLDPEARIASCAEFGLAADRANSYALAAFLGAQVCGNAIVDMAALLRGYQAVRDHAEQWHAKYGKAGGAWAIVRLRTDILFALRNRQSISWREFRVLAGIYSVIGAKPYPVRITLNMIDARHCGFLSPSDLDRGVIVGDCRPSLTPKQLRLTIEKLWLLKWFARVTPDPHGRRTYYSHRMSEAEMREKLFTKATVKLAALAAQRAENEKLAARIRAAREALHLPTANSVHHSHVDDSGGRSGGRAVTPSRQQTGLAEGASGAPLIESPSMEIPRRGILSRESHESKMTADEWRLAKLFDS